MLIALLCESEMKLADETIEIILDKVSYLKTFGLLVFRDLKHIIKQLWGQSAKEK